MKGGVFGRVVYYANMRFLIRFTAVVLGLFLAHHFVSGIEIAGWYSAVMTAIVLGLMNVFVRPVLWVLTLPITVVTFGLFTFVLNALLFWFVGSFIQGFDVSGFPAALVGSLLVTLMSWISTQLTID